MLSAARPRVHAIVLRSYPPPRGNGFDEFSWVASHPNEGGRETPLSRWVGDLEVRYTTVPLGEDRLVMVPVLTDPTGAERIVSEAAFALVGVDERVSAIPVDMDLAERGEYELRLREGRRETGGVQLGADCAVYGRLRFERV